MEKAVFRPAWAEVNLDNLNHNIRKIRGIVNKEAQVMAIIKADGYGHGALKIYRELLENGAQSIGVAVVTEALQLREDGYEGPLLVMGYTSKEFYPLVVKNDITQAIYTLDQARELSMEAKRQNKNAKIHIKTDTGMGRLGVTPDGEGLEIVMGISRLDNLEIEGIFTHLAVADDRDKTYTMAQYDKFINFTDSIYKNGINITYRHISNSAAIIDMPELNMDIVRPGIALYGLYPSDEVIKDNIELREVMSLRAKISHVKSVDIGQSVSYGRKFIASRKSVIATLPLGYADGFTRLLSGRAEVLVKGKRAPVVGRICMDQCMVDVTDIEGVQSGDEVVLFGKQGEEHITIDEVANRLGTIKYEVVCMIQKRIPRIYIKNGGIIDIQDSIYNIK
jgi:alanine racemase